MASSEVVADDTLAAAGATTAAASSSNSRSSSRGNAAQAIVVDEGDGDDVAADVEGVDGQALLPTKRTGRAHSFAVPPRHPAPTQSGSQPSNTSEQGGKLSASRVQGGGGGGGRRRVMSSGTGVAARVYRGGNKRPRRLSVDLEVELSSVPHSQRGAESLLAGGHADDAAVQAMESPPSEALERYAEALAGTAHWDFGSFYSAHHHHMLSLWRRRPR